MPDSGSLPRGRNRILLKFEFVNTTTGDFLELDLVGIFARARGIYPTWSISF